jgi:hypothetical protein
MALPNLPPIAALSGNGVRRLSAGSSIVQAAIGRTGRIVSSFLGGSMSEMFDKPADYTTLNRLLAVASPLED